MSSGESNLSLTALFIFMMELIVIFCIEPVKDYDWTDYLGTLLRLGVVGLLVTGISKVSSTSTLSSFFGGVVFAVVVSYVIAKYYIEIAESNIYIWIIIAIIVGFFGTVGDLIESKFKRVAGVKDSGKIMPGHGGVLDRLDSVIFVAPIVFLFYQILNYVS